MYRFLSVEDAKAEAKAILETLRDLNPETEVPLGHCLELVGRRAGFESWRAYKAFLEPEPEEIPEDQVGGRVYVKQMTREQVMEEARRMNNQRDVLLSRPVTKEAYAEAVVQLLNTTQMSGTSGARACARLLLSLYNSSEWHFDMSEMGLLDYENYVPAVIAIRGREELMIEPHQLVENGDDIFSALWSRFERFRKTEIWKPECKSCEGRGQHWDDDADDWGEECSKCDGRGYYDPADPLIDRLKEIKNYSVEDHPGEDHVRNLTSKASSVLFMEGIYD